MAESGALGANASMLDLVPETDATHRAVQSGRWDDPSVWADGAVPGDGARVLVEQDAAVTVAHQGTARLESVRVDGTLTFDPTVDTRLRVDTLVTSPQSRLQIGTAETPVDPSAEARITFVDTGPIDESEDPERKGRGLVAGGDVQIHGAQKAPWTRLSSAPAAGDGQLTLAEAPTNWTPGDRIVVPGITHEENQDEEARIAAVDGTTIELDTEFAHDHTPPADDLDAYALNLSRNVVFESESTDVPRRGHIMFMATATDVRYAAFRNLGRTDKSIPFSNPTRGDSPTPAGENVKARYAFHYHKTGIDADEPHIAEGLVADGSPGWGIVNHHAYAHIRDSITYDVDGAGFVAEGGNERGTFERNFALRSAGSGETIDSRAHGAHGGDPAIDDFGHAGHGFWFQSPLVEVVDNVAAGHRHQAFVWWLRPLLDGPLAEGMDVDDSRVSFWPNLPIEYADVDRPLWEAIQEGRFGPRDQLAVDTQKIPSTFANVAPIKGNTAFASAGGADFSRHNFKWKHERFSDFTVIEDMTVYNIGPFVDADGDVHEPDLPRHRASGHQGRGGSVGVSFRYTSNVTLRNSHLRGTGRDQSVGVPFHDYLWTSTVDDCTIENWDWGVDTGEHRLTWVRNNTLRDNTADVNWGFDNVGPAIVDGNDLQTIRYDYEPNNQKASEVLDTGGDDGVRIDGRTAYVEESAADHVPFPDEDALGGINNIESTLDSVDDETNLIGLTNAEMQSEFGVSIGGALMPDDAVSEPWLDGAMIDPETSTDPPESVWMDLENASGSSFDVVSEEDAANGQAIRFTADSPEDDPASVSFECADGTYELYVRAWTSSWNGDDIYFRVDGGEWLAAEKLKSPIGWKWYDAEPKDGDRYTFDLSAGQHTVDVYCPDDDVLLDEVFVSSDATVLGAYGESSRTTPGTTEPENSSQSPYADHDLSRIEAEDFDTGGEGVAYHDTSSGNNGGAYRDTDVDIQATSDEGGGYNLAWLEEGEWWEYTVEVPSDGTYVLRARLAGKNATTLDVAVDGSRVATVDVPNTGGWQNWTTVDAGAVDLSSGTSTIRLTANGGDFNFNWFGFEQDEQNEKPSAADDAVTVDNGESVTVDVLSNDSDADGSLDPSSVTVTSSPSNGSATVNADGTVEYTHDGSDTESDSFGYTVADDTGATSNEATVSVTVATVATVIEVTGAGPSSHNNGTGVRYIIETSGTVTSTGTDTLELGDAWGGSKASGRVPADGSDTDTYSLTGGSVTDVSTWGGDVTVTVDGAEWSG